MNYFDTTVIIPSKNRMDMLVRAVTSISLQGVLPVAIIIIDDCSSQPITQSLFENITNLKITILRNQNSIGGAKSRNVGIQNASSKFISFLDDDDCWEPHYIKSVCELLSENDKVAAYTSKSFVLSSELNKVFKESIATDTISTSDLLKGNFVGTTSCVTAQKSFLIDINGFDESLPALQDYECWLRMSLNGILFQPVPKAKVIYTINITSSQISGNYSNHINAKSIISNKYVGLLEQSNYIELESTLNFFVAKAIHRKNYFSSLSYSIKALSTSKKLKLLALFVPYKILNYFGVYSS